MTYHRAIDQLINGIMALLSCTEMVRISMWRIRKYMRAKYIDAVIMISIAVLLLIAAIIQSCGRKKVEVVTVRHDSIQKVIEQRIDTLVKTRVKIKEIYHERIDTIYLYDSIAIDSAYTKAIKRLSELEKSGYFKD